MAKYKITGLPKAQEGIIYRYKGRPEAKYKKDNKGNWLISIPETNGKYVPIKDPTGSRTKVLNAQASPINTYNIDGGKWQIDNGVWTQLSDDALVTNAHMQDRESAYTKEKSEKLFRNITPQGYGDIALNLDRYNRYQKDLGRNKNELLWYSAQDSPTGKPTYYTIPHRDDMFSLYLGLPQKSNSFAPQLIYRPTNEKDPNSLYYKPTYWTEKGKQELLDNYFLMNDVNENIYNERTTILEPIYDSLKQAGIHHSDPRFGSAVMDNPLGDFTVTQGKDDKGTYISIYDKIDFNPFQTGSGSSVNPKALALQLYMKSQGYDVNEDTEGSSILGAGKPYEIYDRIYYDPKTKKIKKQSGGLVKAQKGGQYYTFQGTDYMKQDGKWFKKINGNYMPLTKGDVAKRSAVLDAQAHKLSPYELQQRARRQSGAPLYDPLQVAKPQVASTTQVIPSVPKKEFKSFEQKIADDKALAKYLTQTGKAELFLGDKYWNQKGDQPMEGMIWEEIRKDPDIMSKIDQKEYERWLEEEQKAYDKATPLQKGLNAASAFIGNPELVTQNLIFGSEETGLRRPLVQQHKILRDKEHPMHSVYSKATGYENNWLDPIVNVFNPGAWAADAYVANEKGDYVDAYGNLLLNIAGGTGLSELAEQGMGAADDLARASRYVTNKLPLRNVPRVQTTTNPINTFELEHGLTNKSIFDYNELGDFSFAPFSPGYNAMQTMGTLATYGKQPLLKPSDFATEREMEIDRLFYKNQQGTDPDSKDFSAFMKEAEEKGFTPDEVLKRMLTNLVNKVDPARRSQRHFLDQLKPFNLDTRNIDIIRQGNYNPGYFINHLSRSGKELNEFGPMGGKPPVSFGASGEFDQYYWDQIKTNEDFLTGDYNLSPEQREKIQSKLNSLYQKGIRQGIENLGLEKYKANLSGISPNQYGGQLPNAQKEYKDGGISMYLSPEEIDRYKADGYTVVYE